MDITEEQLAELILTIAKTTAAAISSALSREDILRKVVPALQRAGNVAQPNALSTLTVGPQSLLQFLLSPAQPYGTLLNYYSSQSSRLLSKPGS